MKQLLFIVVSTLMLVVFVELLSSKVPDSNLSTLFMYKIEIHTATENEVYYTDSFITYANCIEFISGTSDKEIFSCSTYSIHKNF